MKEKRGRKGRGGREERRKSRRKKKEKSTESSALERSDKGLCLLYYCFLEIAEFSVVKEESE